jgi:hypothetical protein
LRRVLLGLGWCGRQSTLSLGVLLRIREFLKGEQMEGDDQEFSGKNGDCDITCFFSQILWESY